MIVSPVFEARDQLDAAFALIEMLKMVRFEDVHEVSAQGVHATLERISQQVNEAMETLRLVGVSNNQN